MRRRRGWIITIAIVLLLLAIPIAGMTAAFGTAGQFHKLGAWSPDGAAKDTFWDSPVVDFPGISVTAVHCHGKVRNDLQLGATGPSHSNPCYAAMGAYGYGSAQWEVFTTLPGNFAIYRISQNDAPWRYCVATVAPPPSPGFLPIGPPKPPC